ncbi:MAG: ABC transporter permease [Nitrospinota bacterium]
MLTRSGAIGLCILAIMVGVALFAPLLAPRPPEAQDLARRLVAPGWLPGGDPQYLLGGDHLGRDILSRIIYGSRISLLVGFTAVILSSALGLVLGLTSGYFGGTLDRILMRLADVQLAFPYILLIISVIAVVGPGLWTIIVVLGITGWVRYARVIRGEVLSLREREFIQATHAAGSGAFRILSRHLLPNVMAPLLVIATLELGRIILLEASLSFLGLGVPLEVPSWGGMLSDGRTYVATAWWLATFPGLAMFACVLGINLLGDGLRDTLDPRLRTD